METEMVWCLLWLEKYGSVETMTLPEKISHYWGYYWKLIVAILALIIVVIICTVTMLDNPVYDTSVLMATRGKGLQHSSPLIAALEEKLEQYADDVDENGEINVLCDLIAFPETDEDNMMNQTETALQTRLAGELQLGDSQVFILDQKMYDFIANMDGFVDLQKAFFEYELPSQYAIPLKDTALYDIEIPLPEEGLGTMTLKEYKENNQAILDDLYICLRRDDNLKPERREEQLKLLTRLLADSNLPSSME